MEAKALSGHIETAGKSGLPKDDKYVVEATALLGRLQARDSLTEAGNSTVRTMSVCVPCFRAALGLAPPSCFLTASSLLVGSASQELKAVTEIVEKYKDNQSWPLLFAKAEARFNVSVRRCFWWLCF